MRYFIFMFWLLFSPKVFSQEFLNLGFEQTRGDRMITSWGLGNDAPYFRVASDTNVYFEGQRSLSVERIRYSTKDSSDSKDYVFRVSLKKVDSLRRNHKIIKVSAWIKADSINLSKAEIFIYFQGNKTFFSSLKSMITIDKEKGYYFLETEAPLDSLPKGNNISLGGRFYGSKKVWFDDFKIYFDDFLLKDALPKEEMRTTLTSYQYKWLNNNSFPLHISNSNKNFDDIKRAIKPFLKAKIIALGEATHGTKEFSQIKHRMIEYLCSKENYDCFVIEGDVFKIKRLNSYIQNPNSTEDPQQLISETLYSVWESKEVLEFVKWAHTYNTNNKQKIKFLGIDINDSRALTNEIEDFATKNNDTLLLKKLMTFRVFEKNRKFDSLDFVVNQMDSIYKNRQSKIKQLDVNWEDIYFIVLKQYAQYKALAFKKSPNAEDFRDSCMATNFNFITYKNPKSKFIFWAHNAHIVKNKRALGMFLGDKYKQDYKNIALTTSRGVYTSFYAFESNWYKSELIDAYDGTWEKILSTLKYENFFLNLDKEKDIYQLRNLNLECRDIGANLIRRQFSQYYNLLKDFDAVIFLKNTTGSENFNIKEDKK